jgi:cell division protein ZipA
MTSEPLQRATGRREPLWTPEDAAPPEPEELVAKEPEPVASEPEVPEPVTEEPEDAAGESTELEVADWDLEQLGEIIQEERSKKREPRAEVEQFSFSFLSSDAPEKQSAVEKKPLPTKLIQLNVVPRHGQFQGQELLYAVSETGLQFGDLNIYHFPNEGMPEEEPLFSMANIVEPGSFDPDQMDDFLTPGLVLFAMLPGPKDGLTVFSEMLNTAEQLATLMDGEIKDESHSDLSKQTIEHMREEIQEYHRKLQLAKSAR